MTTSLVLHTQTCTPRVKKKKKGVSKLKLEVRILKVFSQKKASISASPSIFLTD